MIEVEGLVLKETLYMENSKILKILTKNYGVISVISKGCLKTKSSLKSLSIPFLYGKFSIIYKKGKISTLTDGTIIKNYGNYIKNVKVYAYLSYLCELTLKVSEENYNEKIFYIIISGINKIVEGLNPCVIKNIIEFKYLKYIGITPNFDICQKCFKEITESYAIDGASGGFICSDCYHNEIKVSPNFIKILKRYEEVDLDNINEIRISKEDESIVNDFLKTYYDTFSYIKLNSRLFLDQVK